MFWSVKSDKLDGEWIISRIADSHSHSGHAVIQWCSLQWTESTLHNRPLLSVVFKSTSAERKDKTTNNKKTNIRQDNQGHDQVKDRRPISRRQLWADVDNPGYFPPILGLFWPVFDYLRLNPGYLPPMHRHIVIHCRCPVMRHLLSSKWIVDDAGFSSHSYIWAALQ